MLCLELTWEIGEGSESGEEISARCLFASVLESILVDIFDSVLYWDHSEYAWNYWQFIGSCVFEACHSMQVPVFETSNNMQVPVFEISNNVQVPVVDASHSMQVPVIEASDSMQVPGLLV